MNWRPTIFELDPKHAQAWQMALDQQISEITLANQQEQLLFVQQILSSALLNGEKSLVLANDLSLLQTLRLQLETGHLTPYLNLLRAEEWSGNHFTKLLEAKTAAYISPKITASKAFELNLEKLERTHQRLSLAYESVRKPIFGHWNWSETIGHFLTLKANAGKERLNLTIGTEGFSFTLNEFGALSQLLEEAQSRYFGASVFNHPLNGLHPHVFQQKNVETAAQFSKDKLQAYSLRIGSMAHRYGAKMEEYEHLLRQHLNQHTQSLFNQTRALLEQIGEVTKTYGVRFAETKSGKLGWFSAEGKTAAKYFQKIITDFQGVKFNFDKLNWFPFSWPGAEKGITLSAISAALSHFEAALKAWHFDQEQFIQEELLRLNSNTALPELGQHNQLAFLEEAMEDLLTELNVTSLLSNSIAHKMLTLFKRKQMLGELRHDLEHLQSNLPDFAQFYAWQQFWLIQDDLSQNLIKALAKVKEKDWKLVFQFWYLQQVILKAKTMDLPAAPLPLEDYYQHWQSFTSLAPAQLAKIWQGRWTQLQQKIRKSRPRFGQKNQQKDLTITTQLESLSEYYPLLLVQQTALQEVSQDIPTQIFDWIIVFEDDTWTQSQIQSLKSCGHKLMVVAKKSEERANNATSLPIDSAEINPESMFWSAFHQEIRPYFAPSRWTRPCTIEELNLPLALQPLHIGNRGTVFVADGFLSNTPTCDFAWEYQQQTRLQQQWNVQAVWSTAIWTNLAAECRKMAAKVISAEKQ